VADSLWGSTPMTTLSMDALALCRWDGTARWASLLRAGQSPLEPRLVTAPDGPQTEIEPHPHAGGQPKIERSAEHLDRVWPNAGPGDDPLVAHLDAAPRPCDRRQISHSSSGPIPPPIPQVKRLTRSDRAPRDRVHTRTM